MLARSKHFLNFLARLVDRVERWSNLGGSWLVVFLMMLVTCDVAYRFLLRRSIVGVYTLSEQIMVGICFLTLAYCQRQRGHVRVEFVVDRFRGNVAQYTAIVVSILCLFICVLLFYQTTVEATLAVDMRLYTSGIVKWPVSPFKILVAFGFFLLSIRVGIQLAEQVRWLTAKGRHHAR